MKSWKQLATVVMEDDNDDNVCYLCGGNGTVCPGCTGGKIQKIDSRLFMGCGVEIRCPVCFGIDVAYIDKLFMKKYYNDVMMISAYYDNIILLDLMRRREDTGRQDSGTTQDDTGRQDANLNGFILLEEGV